MKENRDAFTRVGLAAEPAVAVFAAVEIVRREDDEAALGQLRGEIVIVRASSPSTTSLGTPSASVLADDHGPPLARLEILGHQQNAPGKHVLPDVEHHFVADPLFRVVDLARAGIEGRQGLVEPAQDLFRKVLAIPLRAFDELAGGIVW